MTVFAVTTAKGPNWDSARGIRGQREWDEHDETELRSVFAADPWARSGILRVKEVRSWILWLDGR